MIPTALSLAHKKTNKPTNEEKIKLKWLLALRKKDQNTQNVKNNAFCF